jgi:NAD(P)H-hydrate epimerase
MKLNLKTFKIDSAYVGKVIPPRLSDAHKRMNGTVCVVGGSRLYHGAPFLCGQGAMRSGVDLVYVAVPRVIAPSIRSLSPDFIVIPLPDSKLTRGNVSKLLAWVKGIDVFAVGPGLGAQNPDHVARCLAELKGESKALVVDADALLPGAIPSIRKSKTVVTPHATEFERLFGVKLPHDLDERVTIVSEEAKKAGVVVLLKGPTDVISDGEEVGLNSTHTPAMTVGGTGDVLTGITSGLLAKGLEPFAAASAAAYINGAAGVEAVQEMGLHIMASDVANRIAKVMKTYDRLV